MDLDNSSNSLSAQSLVTLRSVVLDPDTADATFPSIFEALSHYLQLSSDSVFIRHVLKLLTDLSSRRRDLASRVFDSVRSHLFAAESNRLAVESLSALASISDGNSSLISSLNDIDDEFLLSLCLEPPVSIRMWLLRNVEKFGVRPPLLLTALLGLSKDPYPYVRAEAFNRLSELCRSDRCIDSDVIEGCYFRAVELLGDSDDSVRAAAVRGISEWGALFMDAKEDSNQSVCSDSVFIQLCSMVRDMSMAVRIEAFSCLGRISIVSEGVLLQTLSKKVLEKSKEKKFLEHHSDGLSEISVTCAAGVFIHGLEDEFHEVRRSAIDTLRLLTNFSIQFSTDALKLLMDMLYDESMIVRLKTLETMHHMAKSGLLRIQGGNMPVFLDALLDSCEKIRYGVRKTLKLVKLFDMKLLNQTVDGLLRNLEIYPQEEQDIFCTLFLIGQGYEKSTAGIIKRGVQEMDSDSCCKSHSATARLAGLLILTLSFPLSNKQRLASIPPRVFSYSITMLGRFAHALGDLMDQNSLLVYLSQCIHFSGASEVDFNKLFFLKYKQGKAVDKYPDVGGTSTSLRQNGGESPESNSFVWPSPSFSHDEMRSINLIFAKIKGLWPMVKSGSTSEVLRALRACKLELASLSMESLGSGSSFEFSYQYVGVIKLLARSWTSVGLKRKPHSYSPEIPELHLMRKLDSKLMKIRCTFSGMSGEDELCILELVLISHLLKLSRLKFCCHFSIMKKLSATIARAEYLHQQGQIEASVFYAEIRTFFENGLPIGDTCCSFLDLEKLTNCFSPGLLTLSRSPIRIHAEMVVPCNKPDKPLQFIPGLPVAIPLQITLHNISSQEQLWLSLSLGEESTQFVFLAPDLLNDSEANKIEFLAPLYVTPKVVSFTLTASLGIECLFEDVLSVERCGGPRHPLVFICLERVYFSQA